jgi:hypothetical protein
MCAVGTGDDDDHHHHHISSQFFQGNLLRVPRQRNLYANLKRHRCASKLATTYNMTIMYFLVDIDINNQSTLYKVNGVVSK